MCLAAWAVAQSPRFPWVLASNRDEFFKRPAAPLGWWQAPGSRAEVLSGRDLSAGGTWLGLSRGGRLALVTNVREPGRFDPMAASRGALVLQALIAARAETPTQAATPSAPADAAGLLATAAVPRNGYNLVVADLRGGGGVWASNRPAPQARTLGAGLFGLSNAALDTPWPKVTQLKQRLATALAAAQSSHDLAAAAFAALADRQCVPDAALPATGVPLQRERELSPAFIRIDGRDAAGGGAGVYGTRCSTLVIVEQVGAQREVQVIERRYGEDGATSGETALAFVLA
jgi:uncharacterized protein with NRDE domain